MTDEAHQLRRRLRAMAAVNSQLRGQLDDRSRTIPVLATRRAQTARTWQFDTEHVPLASLDLVVSSAGPAYVIERGRRRRIKAGLLMPALERAIGTRRAMSAAAIDDLPEGPPVEVLEGPSGPPFLVLGGQRVPLRGLPVPYPVDIDTATGLPQGPVMSVKPTLSNRALIAMIRVRVVQRVAARGGAATAALGVGRRAARAARAQVRRLR